MSNEMVKSGLGIQLPDNLSVALEFAERISRTALIPEALRGKPDEVLAVMVYGRELGMEPMRAVRSINFIKGTPTLKAEAIAAMVMASAVCEELTLLDSTDRAALYYAKRVGASKGVEMGYTLAQAQRAGLTNNPTWKNHPEAMLRARAVTSICRAVFPDVYGGLYSEDEAQEIADRREARSQVEPKPDPRPAARPRPEAAAATVGRRTEALRHGTSAPPAAVEDAEVVEVDGHAAARAVLAAAGLREAQFDAWALAHKRSGLAAMTSAKAATVAQWLAGDGAATVRAHVEVVEAAARGPDSPNPGALQAALEGNGIPAELADAWARHKGIKPAAEPGCRALWLSIMHPVDDEFDAFRAEWDRAHPDAAGLIGPGAGETPNW